VVTLLRSSVGESKVQRITGSLPILGELAGEKRDSLESDKETQELTAQLMVAPQRSHLLSMNFSNECHSVIIE
jgi:hypothetical protein